MTWDTCYLRTWLNNDFYQTAFTLAKQELICLTTVTADKNPNPQYAELYPGKDTQDHVFIPSMLEIQKYMPRASDRLCRPTQYAIDRYASNINGCSWWWLRTRGDRKTWTGIINVDGTMPLDGERVNGKKGVVRPCIWVKIPQSANTSASSGSENANKQTNGSSSPANASSNAAGKLDYKTYASYNWVKAYREFLLSGNYAKDQQYVMDGEPIVYALYDMNRDNVPELFISNGDKTLYGARMYVYTYAEEQLKYCGIVKYIYKLADEEANKKYPGLFEEERGAGTYLSYYVKLDANHRIEYTKIETRHDFETDYKTNDRDLLAVKDMQKNNVTKYRIGIGEFEISVVEWCSAH